MPRNFFKFFILILFFSGELFHGMHELIHLFCPCSVIGKIHCILLFLCVFQINFLFYRALSCKLLVAMEAKLRKRKNIKFYTFFQYFRGITVSHTVVLGSLLTVGFFNFSLDVELREMVGTEPQSLIPALDVSFTHLHLTFITHTFHHKLSLED